MKFDEIVKIIQIAEPLIIELIKDGAPPTIDLFKLIFKSVKSILSAIEEIKELKS
jgi:hypothetical protein